MSSINHLRVVILREGYAHILLTIGDKKYLTDEISEDKIKDYLHPFCTGTKDDTMCHFVPAMGENNVLYMECKECKIVRYVKKILPFDALMVDDKIVMLDAPPHVQSVSMKDVLKKSKAYQESLIKEESFFQFLMRLINTLIEKKNRGMFK